MIPAALVAALLIAALLLVLALAPSIVMSSLRASEVAPDQAPLAHTLLADFAPVAGAAQPRLFVIPASQPNGLAVAGRGEGIVVVTEGVFEKLDARQLQGSARAVAREPGAPARSDRDRHCRAGVDRGAVPASIGRAGTGWYSRGPVA